MEENQIKLKYLVEGVLFASGEPISLDKLSDLLSSTKEDIENSILELINEYQEENRCFDIIKNGSENKILYQIVTNKNISSIVQKLNNTVLEGDLTKSALDVLSIVMYRAPLNRSEIDDIRGVNSSYILRSLVLRGLINRYQNPDRRNEYLYEPSFELLKHLGINDVSCLPDFEELHSSSLKDLIQESLDLDKEKSEINKDTEGNN
ncbi:MAG: SMC-Scp complex subunit ScpB [Candidatus Pacebacteria bacterium]|nr:SMC-Scp complex subunit ScpB [Candidatus Paceibacterota bacterium]